MAKSTTPQLLLCFRSIIKNDYGQILLVKRTKDRKYNPNKWELPGGKLEGTGDISVFIEQTLEKETNLVVKNTSSTYYYQSHLVTDPGKYYGFTYIEISSEAKFVGGSIKIGPDHSDYAWVSKDQIFSYDLSLPSKKSLTQYFSESSTKIQILISAKALIKNSQGKYLVLKRFSADTTEPSKWDIPGGKLDSFEVLSESLKREVFEETSLVVKITKPTLYLHSHVLNKGKYQGFSFIEIISEAEVTAGKIKLSLEHDSYRWISPTELLELDLSTHLRLPLTEIFLSI
ncbi:MAG: NUDIX domain-containing protein [Patescibacteria group bacterium]